MRLKIMILMAGFLVSSSCLVLAQEMNPPSVGFSDQGSRGTFSVSGYQKEVKTDEADIQAERDKMQEDAATDRQEDRQLDQEIQTAEQSGDTSTADALKQELNTTNEANAQQMQKDEQAMQSDQKALRKDEKKERHSYREDRQRYNRDYRHEQRERLQERRDYRQDHRDNRTAAYRHDFRTQQHQGSKSQGGEKRNNGE